MPPRKQVKRDPDALDRRAPFGLVDPPVPNIASFRQGWQRPPLPAISPSADAITIQQVDLDQYYGPPDLRFYPPGTSGAGERPILRIFGVNDNGNSITVHVHGFQPYFYVRANNVDRSKVESGEFASQLDRAVGQKSKGMGANTAGRCVERVEWCTKQTLMNYQKDSCAPFLKITMIAPHHVSAARGIFEQSGQQTFESNVVFPLRFMIDRDLSGGGWCAVQKGDYQVRPAHQKTTSCQLEIDVHHAKVQAMDPNDGDWGRIAPLRILSFDIECFAKKGFPEAEKNPVIQIASLLTVQGETEPTVRNVLTLGTCDPIADAEVMPFQREEDLLMAWSQLVQDTDPDIITGYNINNFDLPYLLDRASTLRLDNFARFSRVLHNNVRAKKTTFSSKAQGTRESKEITCEGRVPFDLMQAIQRDYKLSSYSLNSVSAEFLGDQKEDVHHSMISVLQEGNEDSRRRLAVYCIKDAALPQQLMDKLMYMYNYIEMARVTGVPIGFLLGRGQMIKVMSQLMRKGKQQNLVLPVKQKFGQGQGGQLGGNEYEGATVLDAISGFYEEPIATLDFASLYPSIMQAHNLCYTTLVPKDQEKNFSDDDVSRSPTGDVFVKPHVRAGVLPEILTELLTARKRAKADLKKATDPMQRAVLDGRQLALKVSANSVYGFTGATVGQLPCLEISASVTSYGRQMIDHTKSMVESHYSKANGYPYDAQVVYGDTDSVFVKFGPKDVKEAMKVGEEASAMVTKTFLSPIKLEFEKVYCPLLLITKKRYAGLKYLDPNVPPKMDATGVETVRRDNCEFVRSTMTIALDMILKESNVQGAIDYVKHRVSSLLQNKLDLSQMIITKGYTKKAEDYDSKQGHIELAMKMKKRDPLTAPNVGDRVPYVIIEGPKGMSMCERCEDPLYVLENGIPIDNQYYLTNQLKEPLKRLFSPVMKNPDSLFNGEHTMKVGTTAKKMGGAAKAGSLMSFVQKSEPCLSPGCRIPVSSKDEATCVAFCKECRTSMGSMQSGYLSLLTRMNEVAERRARLMVAHNRVHHLSSHQDNFCTSRECRVFFMCKKAEVDHKAVSEKFERCLRGFQQLGMSPLGAVAPHDLLGGYSKTCGNCPPAAAAAVPKMAAGGSKVKVEGQTAKRSASSMLVD
jgi:DNA polymerase delta subunit 1